MTGTPPGTSRQPARVALIGATGHGAWHRRVIAELQEAVQVELVALGDVREIPGVPPGVPVYADHRALLAHAHPDIAVICTPPHTHLPIATDAARAGADLLLEKPPVLDLEEHAALERVLAETGRVCQVGFQALGSPALAELLSTVDSGGLGELTTITMRGAWFRDEAYFHRSAWVGRSTVDGRPTLDGALANPFAHSIMQVLAIARATPTLIEVERYRTRTDIEVDDTAALRLTFPGGLRALIAVSLCAEEYVPGEIVVTGTAGQAVHEYPTDGLRLPGEAAVTRRPGRINLLGNLVDHRAEPEVPLLVPLARTAGFTAVLGPVTAAPVADIDRRYLTTRTDLDNPRLVVTGINAALQAAVADLALFSELSQPWALPSPAPVPGGTR